MLQISGYQDTLDKVTDSEKFENIKALRDWFNNKQLSEENLTLNNLLDEITLYQEEENSQSTKSANQISLMTIHQAKGLEFKYVFMIKLTQGILPDYRCDKLEEERRLFYVGITRAKKELFLSCSTYEKKMEQSVFLAEIEDLADLDMEVNQIKDFADLEDFTGPDENDHEINKLDQMFKKKINLKS